MAITWADNFQMYGLGASGKARLSQGVYQEVSSNDFTTLVEDPDPNISTPCMQIEGFIGFSSNTARFRKDWPSPSATKGIGFRVWFSDFYTTAFGSPSWVFKDNLGNLLTTIQVFPTGQLRAFRGAPADNNVLGTTAGPVLVTGAWQHVEIKMLASATVGTLEVRVEGQAVLTLTGINTSASGNQIASFVWTSIAGPTGPTLGDVYPWNIKDLVMWDTTGTQNNDFIGSVSVYTLVPDGDISNNWTPSTGTTGWQILDNIPADDSQYISADDTPPSDYVGTLTNLPPDVTSVKALVTVVRARKTDGGDANLQVSLISGAVPDDGADRPMTTAFTYWSDVSELDPNTGSAWTPATADAARIRLERTL